MPMPASDQTTPYGRACNQCVKAKAKCTLRDGACERCLRLRKDCQPAVGARRKPGRKPAASRTDALEARLNGIMTLLENVPGLQRGAHMGGAAADTAAQPHAHNLSAANTVSVDFQSRRITYSPHEVYMKRTQQTAPAFEGTMASSPAPPHTSPDYHQQRPPPEIEIEQHAPGQDHLPGLSARDAEDALNRFRHRSLKHFPFVHIPDARVSASRLRQTRPLLWLSIMACAARSADLQDRLCDRLRRAIADHAIVQHQRSVDLLLGIVGLLGWGTYYLKKDRFMLMYCHVATAIVQDLGLDREPPAPRPAHPAPASCAVSRTASPGTRTSTSTGAASPPTPPEPHPLSCFRTHGFAIKLLESPVRTMEERRAVLATFFATALVSLFYRRNIALPWTDHMDECLRVLDADPETPLDRLLVYQCRLQRIALDIPPPHAYAAITSAREMRQLRDLQVNALVARQRAVEAQMPVFDEDPDLNKICRQANVANEAAIYGVALYATATDKTKTADQPAAERARCGPDVERAALLHAGLRLHKAYFDMTFGDGGRDSDRDSDSDRNGGDADAFAGMFSFHTVTQMAYFLVGVYRLASFGRDDPCSHPGADPGGDTGWDADWARAQLDVPRMVDTLARRFDDVAAHFSRAPRLSDAQGDFFARAARGMRMLKTTWMATWAKEKPPAPALPVPPDLNDAQTAADTGLATPTMDFLDPSAVVLDDMFPLGSGMSAWMSDMFTDWQVQY